MYIAVHVQTVQSNLDLIVVSGHADDQEETEVYRLVCAEVSAVSVGILNSIDELCPDSCECTMEDGFVSIKVRKSSEMLQTILKTFVIQLDTIEYTNKNYVKIEKVEV